MILLEYNEKQGFHHNMYILHNKRFNSVLYSWGWFPVCPISEEILRDPDYEALIDRIEGEMPAFRIVVQEILTWVMDHYERQETDL